MSTKYDDEGNLWLLQSQVAENAIVEITKDGQWISRYQEKLMENGKSLNSLRSLIIDNEGMLWFVNTHHVHPAIICYNPKNDEIVQFIDDFSNQDGISTANCKPLCIAEDLEGNIWVGTTTGPYMIEKENRYISGTYLTQVKVPRNDGSNYADYLLANVKTTCIAIDGANRKWFGTEGAGAYLISADNMEQLQNFTAENSRMLSNFIESMAINNETGEVFFGTDMGLCSYVSDATTAEPTMVKDNVYAYPNPVVKDYQGLITVVGLSMDADVKILSTSGKLIAQGRSNGGTFTWNGRDSQGRRVASGIYMVATATSDGNKGTVCKIAVIN
jgi:ligand-binding sensor domain-containing protein